MACDREQVNKSHLANPLPPNARHGSSTVTQTVTQPEKRPARPRSTSSQPRCGSVQLAGVEYAAANTEACKHLFSRQTYDGGDRNQGRPLVRARGVQAIPTGLRCDRRARCKKEIGSQGPQPLLRVKSCFSSFFPSPRPRAPPRHLHRRGHCLEKVHHGSGLLKKNGAFRLPQQSTKTVPHPARDPDEIPT